MRMIAATTRDRQRVGTHLLCGNVDCRVPLEPPHLLINLIGALPEVGIVRFDVAVCEICAAKAKGARRVSLDHETSYAVPGV